MELLIIDNLATLCRVGKENESESWLPIQTWLLTLRRRGIAVILIHHANKSGGQRGTSSRENVMDSVIALRPTKDQTPKDTARFEVHLEKSRGIAGSAIEPFEATLVATDDTYHWTMRGLECAAVEMVAQLHAEGVSLREIEKITGISKSQVHRMTGALSQKMAPRASHPVDVSRRPNHKNWDTGQIGGRDVRQFTGSPLNFSYCANFYR